MLELFGACALAPAIVARLEPLSARLRGSLRLGARTLARHRARTGAVVSAVAAAGALAVVAGALVLGSERQNGDEVEIPDDVVVATVDRYDGPPGHPTLDQVACPPTSRTSSSDAFPDAESVELRGARRRRGGERLVTGRSLIEPPGNDDVYLGPTRRTSRTRPLLDALRADDEVRSALASTVPCS